MRGQADRRVMRALVTVEDPEAVALRIVEGGLTVREAEGAEPRGGEAGTAVASAPREGCRYPRTREAARRQPRPCRDDRSQGQCAGQLAIRYTSLEQLDELCRLLKRE